MNSARLQVTLCLCLTVCLWVGGVMTRIHHYDWRPSSLVGFGCHPEVCFAERNRRLLPQEAVVFVAGGYDGQFFYYLATELAERSAHLAARVRAGITGGPTPAGAKPVALDSEPFRRARIGLPLLVFPWGWFGPQMLLWGFLATMLALHLVAAGLAFRLCSGGARWPAWVFALNPLSLYSFLLVTADGTAAALAVCGLVAWQRGSHLGTVVGGLLFALAGLCKETMLVMAAALALSAVLRRTIVVWRGDRPADQARSFREAAVGILAVLPTAAWWWVVGFSPLAAAERGSAPFVGMLRYLSAPDALWSPRSLLVVLLVILTATCILLLARVWLATRQHPDSIAGSEESDLLSAPLVLGGALVPAVLAATPEYWGTYANIARLFTPTVVAWLFVQMALGGAGREEQSPGRRGQIPKITARLLILAAWVLALLTGLQLYREARSGGLEWRLQTEENGSSRKPRTETTRSAQ